MTAGYPEAMVPKDTTRFDGGHATRADLDYGAFVLSLRFDRDGNLEWMSAHR